MRAFARRAARGLALWSAIALCVSALPAGGQAQPAGESSGQLTSAQAREDFDLVIAAVEAGLPNIYWHQSAEHWRTAKARASAALAQVRDDWSLYRLLIPLMSGIGEGHLSFQPSEAMLLAGRNSRRFPLDLHWNTEGVFVVAGHGDAADIARGTRLLSIDGEGFDTLVREIMIAYGTDGSIPTQAMRAAGGAGYGSFRYRLRGEEPVFHLRLRVADGSTVERDVHPIPYSGRPALPETTTSTLATLEWVNPVTAYLSVPTFSNKRYRAAGAKFPDTIKARFTEIARGGARNLILDLRENGGGSEPNESILFSYLTSRLLHKYAAVEARGSAVSITSNSGKHFETTVFDDEELRGQRRINGGRLLRLNKAPEGLMSRWAVFAPVFHGRLVVLAGGRTFSGGAELASMLWHTHRGVFVGEEVGGSDQGNTSGYSWNVVLPNSGLRLSVPLLQFRLNWRPMQADRGVFPQCDVPPEVMEIGNRKDKAWRVALTLLDQNWVKPANAVCPR